MPYYDYKCDVHGTFEAQQSIKDPPLDRCPKCVKEGLVEYHCEACDTIVRLPVGKADSLDVDLNKIKCISCGVELAPRWPKPKKLISLSSFILVGGGWAKDNYK